MSAVMQDGARVDAHADARADAHADAQAGAGVDARAATHEVRWVPVGTFHDIPPRGARRIVVGEGEAERTIAVFRTASDALFALEDRCPHRGGPLSQGIVHDDCVTCPLHNLVIGLSDGTARGPDDGTVARYALRREGDAVLLAPDAPLAESATTT